MVVAQVAVVVADMVVLVAQFVGVIAITLRFSSTTRGFRCLYKAISSRLSTVTVTTEVEQRSLVLAVVVGAEVMVVVSLVLVVVVGAEQLIF